MAMLVIYGCATEKYGGASGGGLPVKVRDVMLEPSYQGKLVTVEGIILTQCVSNGCWLFVHDGTGQIYVDMAPAGFKVPPRQGKKAKVTGEARVSKDGVYIVAHGIEVK